LYQEATRHPQHKGNPMFAVIGQLFFSTLAIFCLMTGFSLGTHPLAAICGLGLLVGVIGFIVCTRAYARNLNSY
jgi:hypothetical protein